MSEFLGYDIEAEEADPIAEEDLIYLNDISVNLDLIVRDWVIMNNVLEYVEGVLCHCC